MLGGVSTKDFPWHVNGDALAWLVNICIIQRNIVWLLVQGPQKYCLSPILALVLMPNIELSTWLLSRNNHPLPCYIRAFQRGDSTHPARTISNLQWLWNTGVHITTIPDTILLSSSPSFWTARQPFSQWLAVGVQICNSLEAFTGRKVDPR